MAEVRESIELVHTAEYANFLRVFFPPFVQLLRDLPPSFSDNADHKLRNVLLEILNRCKTCPAPEARHGICRNACVRSSRDQMHQKLAYDKNQREARAHGMQHAT